MNPDQNLNVARQFLSRLGAGDSPDEIAKMFSPDLVWDIPGDVGVLPWIGHKTGRAALTDFIRDTQLMVERLRFNVHEVLAGDNRVVILGDLATLVKSTGKTIETNFAIVLTIAENEITRFLMLEDSFAVSRAARN